MKSRQHILGLIVAMATAVGCGSDVPFDIVPVNGKVTYEDGSLISASKIQVNFNPIAEQERGPITAPGGQTEVNIADGTFSSVMSRRPDDGVALGRHKVVVVSFEGTKEGMPAPSNAVPKRYHREATTPLEIEVTSSNQFIEIKVSKK